MNGDLGRLCRPYPGPGEAVERGNSAIREVGGTDRHERRDHPHVGAALRLPGAGAHLRGLPALPPVRRRGAAARARLQGGRPVVPAALERARAASAAATRPSLFAAIAQTGRVPARMLRKRTLLAISSAFEDETLAARRCRRRSARSRARSNYRAVEHRYRRLASVADVTVVLADFDAVSGGEGDAGRGAAAARTTRSPTSGRSSSTRRASPPACWPGSRRSARRRRATSTAGSRPTGRSIPRSCAAPRWRRPN